MDLLRRLAWHLAPLDEADLERSALQRAALAHERRDLLARLERIRERAEWVAERVRVLRKEEP